MSTYQLSEGARQRAIEERRRQGLPPTIEDPGTLAAVAAIILGAEQSTRATTNQRRIQTELEALMEGQE